MLFICNVLSPLEFQMKNDVFDCFKNQFFRKRRKSTKRAIFQGPIYLQTKCRTVKCARKLI